MLFYFKHLDALLRGERTDHDHLKQSSLALPLRVFVPCAAALGGIYGFFMGWYAIGSGRTGALLHIASTTLKLPLLFLATLLVTFPSLYIFNALVGCRLSFWATMRLLVAAVVVNLAIGASFGPILGFFTLSTTNYHFMVLLNVALLGLAGMISLGFLLRTLRKLAAATAAQQAALDPQPDRPAFTQPAAAPESATTEADRQPRSSRVNQYVGSLDEPALPAPSLGAADTIFRVWVVIYGLVGAQMGWILRPFIGSPNEAFAFLRPRDGNFFLSIGQTIRGVFGW